MTTQDKLVLRSALKSLRESGERGKVLKVFREYVDIDTDSVLSNEQFETLRSMLLDRQYARSYYTPVTNELRMVITQRGMDAENCL